MMNMMSDLEEVSLDSQEMCDWANANMERVQYLEAEINRLTELEQAIKHAGGVEFKIIEQAERIAKLEAHIKVLEGVLRRIGDSGIENNIGWAWIGGVAQQAIAAADKESISDLINQNRIIEADEAIAAADKDNDGECAYEHDPDGFCNKCGWMGNIAAADKEDDNVKG